MKNGFQVAKFLFEVQKTSNLFCLAQNGPVVIWVACNGPRGSYRGSFRNERGFSEAFWTFSPVSLVKYTAGSVAWSIVEFLQWKIVFKSKNFNLKSKSLQIFFWLVQNGPFVLCITCIGLRGSSRVSLTSERGFSEAFWNFRPVSLVKYIAVLVAWSIVEFLQWKMVFKLQNFYLKSKRLQIFFLPCGQLTSCHLSCLYWP